MPVSLGSPFCCCVALQRVQAGDSLTLPFCARALTPHGGSQAHLKLPVPGWVAAAPHTGRPEHLRAIPQLTVCINLLHVGGCHAPVPASTTQPPAQGLQMALGVLLVLCQSSFPSILSLLVHRPLVLASYHALDYPTVLKGSRMGVVYRVIPKLPCSACWRKQLRHVQADL